MKLADNLNNVRLDYFYGSNYIWFGKDSKAHHTNGPSIVRSDGYRVYVINGLRHNRKGAALICIMRREYYFLDGERLTKKEWQEEVRNNEIKR